MNSTPGWVWTNAGSSNISAGNDVIEISMPWSALGVALPKRMRFTVMIAQNSGGDTKDVGGANALDCITWTAGNTWAEVSDTVIDYYFDVWFGSGGNPFSPILISEVHYYTPDDANREWIQITNVSGGSLALPGYKLGDAETKGETGEGMKMFPSGMIANGSSVVAARRAAGFASMGYGCLADYEFNNTDGTPDMATYSWGTGSVDLDNGGEEVLSSTNGTQSSTPSRGVEAPIQGSTCTAAGRMAPAWRGATTWACPTPAMRPPISPSRAARPAHIPCRG